MSQHQIVTPWHQTGDIVCYIFAWIAKDSHKQLRRVCSGWLFQTPTVFRYIEGFPFKEAVRKLHVTCLINPEPTIDDIRTYPNVQTVRIDSPIADNEITALMQIGTLEKITFAPTRETTHRAFDDIRARPDVEISIVFRGHQCFVQRPNELVKLILACPNVVCVDFTSTYASHDEPDEFELFVMCDKLRRVCFSQNRDLACRAAKHIAEIPHIQVVDLSGSNHDRCFGSAYMSDDECHHECRCGKHSGFRSNIFEPFVKCVELHTLILSDCTNVNKVVLTNLSLIPNLTYLDISGNDRLETKDLAAICMPKLSTLVIERSDLHCLVIDFIGECPKLETVREGSCDSMDENSDEFDPKRFPLLTDIDLSNMPIQTDVLVRLAKYRTLRKINLGGSMFDVYFFELLRDFPRLQSIDLSLIKLVDEDTESMDVSVEDTWYITACLSLREVNITGVGMSDRSKQQLMNRFGSLLVID
jgi:hypothetical protein